MTFEITASVEDGHFRFDLKEGGGVAAFVSEQLKGNFNWDSDMARNTAQIVADRLVERFCPILAIPYTMEHEEKVDCPLIDHKELDRKRAEYEAAAPQP